MSLDRWNKVDRYINNLLVPSDPVLEAALEASSKAGLPPINVTPSQGKLLQLLARAQGAESWRQELSEDIAPSGSHGRCPETDV